MQVYRLYKVTNNFVNSQGNFLYFVPILSIWAVLLLPPKRHIFQPEWMWIVRSRLWYCCKSLKDVFVHSNIIINIYQSVHGCASDGILCSLCFISFYGGLWSGASVSRRGR